MATQCVQAPYPIFHSPVENPATKYSPLEVRNSKFLNQIERHRAIRCVCEEQEGQKDLGASGMGAREERKLGL